jgi:O-glycosyl hydrolase
MKKILSLSIVLSALCLFQSCHRKPVIAKNAIVDADIEYQTIDGFGVNFNPDQWNGEKQGKIAIYPLVPI